LKRPGKPSGTEVEWDTSASGVNDVNLLGHNKDAKEKQKP
jgi:hypothetical protein